MKCDVRTCAQEATVFKSKANHPGLIKDVQFCEKHAQAGRIIGAVLNSKPKQSIQKEVDKLVDLNK